MRKPDVLFRWLLRLKERNVFGFEEEEGREEGDECVNGCCCDSRREPLMGGGERGAWMPCQGGACSSQLQPKVERPGGRGVSVPGLGSQGWWGLQHCIH